MGRMDDQFRFHGIAALGTDQRIATEAVQEPLGKLFRRKDSVASWINRHAWRNDVVELLSDLFVASVPVQPVVADALESLR